MPAAEHVLDVLVALLVLEPGRVGVRELVDQAELRRAAQDGGQVHLLEQRVVAVAARGGAARPPGRRPARPSRGGRGARGSRSRRRARPPPRRDPPGACGRSCRRRPPCRGRSCDVPRSVSIAPRPRHSQLSCGRRSSEAFARANDRASERELAPTPGAEQRQLRRRSSSRASAIPCGPHRSRSERSRPGERRAAARAPLTCERSNGASGGEPGARALRHAAAVSSESATSSRVCLRRELAARSASSRARRGVGARRRAARQPVLRPPDPHAQPSSRSLGSPICSPP